MPSKVCVNERQISSLIKLVSKGERWEVGAEGCNNQSPQFANNL